MGFVIWVVFHLLQFGADFGFGHRNFSAVVGVKIVVDAINIANREPVVYIVDNVTVAKWAFVKREACCVCEEMLQFSFCSGLENSLHNLNGVVSTRIVVWSGESDAGHREG